MSASGPGTYAERCETILAAVRQYGPTSVDRLRGQYLPSFAWPNADSHEIRAKLMQLRKSGLVTFDPDFKEWQVSRTGGPKPEVHPPESSVPLPVVEVDE